MSQEKQADKAFGLDGTLSKFHCRVFWLTAARSIRRTTGAILLRCGASATAPGRANSASSPGIARTFLATIEQTSYEAEFEAALRLLVHGLDKPR